MNDISERKKVIDLLKNPTGRFIASNFGETVPQPLPEGEVLNHQHRHREILLVLEKSDDLALEDHLYALQTGDAAFIDSRQRHNVYRTGGDFRHIWFFFYPKRVAVAYLEKSNNVKKQLLLPNPIGSTAATLLINRWEQLLFSNAVDLEYHRSQLRAAFELIKGELVNALSSSESVPLELHQQDIVEMICDSIESRRGMECSLADLARLTGYSECYLSRLFHRCTGKTVGMAVNEARMRYVLSCQKHTSCKVLADSLGFSSAAAFWKWRRKNHQLETAMLETRPVPEDE